MLNFENLQNLRSHHEFLSETLQTGNIFLVGGCIRDVLLWITQDPIDIDLTMSGHPDQIREAMKFDEESTSRFRTEKFGTMTLLPKDSKKWVEYELTPFRTEWSYTDVRHPDEIIWSNNLLLDSARRDFSINCLYWTTCVVDIEHQDISEETSQEVILAHLKKEKNIFDCESNTLIITQHEDIAQATGEWKLDTTAVKNIISWATHLWTWKSQDHLSIIIDPHHGIIDLIQWKLQTVGKPDDRFTEDALRIVRWLRFINTINQIDHLDLDFDKKTRRSMQNNAHLVSELSSERLHDEIVKVFKQDNPFGYVSLLHELKLLPLIFPALAATLHNDQPVRYHSFDTYTHTMLCLNELQNSIKHRPKRSDEDYLIKLAMLYHDVGKPEQYEKMGEAIAANPDNPDRSSYEYHTESGAKLALHDFSNLSFSKKECEQIAWYIRRHHRPWEILDGKEEKWAVRLRKLMSDGGYEATINLLDITLADRRWQYNPLQSPELEKVEQLKTLLTQIYEDEGRFTLSDLAISWQDLMDTLDLQAWPEIGDLLHKAFDRVIAEVNERNNKTKIMKYLQDTSSQ